MAELQSRPLNDLDLNEKVSTTEQISAFVVESVKNAGGDSALSNLVFGYDSEEKRIELGTIDGETIGTVDCKDFIVDGMISSVEYDETSHVLSIAWNTDAGSETTEINLSGLVDVYTAGDGLSLSNGVFSLSAKVSDLENDSGYCTSTDIDNAVSAKRDLSDLVYTETGEADAWDKWIVDSPLERYSGAILFPADGPEGELAWAWNDGDSSMPGGKYVRLAWNEDESTWTMTAEWDIATDISATAAGESVDTSLQFVDYRDQTWTVKRYAVADKLALDGDIKRWTGKQIEENASRVFIDNRISGVSGQSDLSVVKLDSNEYASMLTAGTIISNCLYVVEDRFNNMYGQQVKNMAVGTELSDAVTLGQVDKKFGDMFECLSAVRQYDSIGDVPLSAIIDAVWFLSKL